MDFYIIYHKGTRESKKNKMTDTYLLADKRAVRKCPTNKYHKMKCKISYDIDTKNLYNNGYM